MRALAIAMVVCAHALYIFQGYDNAFFDLMRVVGVYGVEVFFVLSGFLIGGILLRLITTTTFSTMTVLYFWVRRWFRTLPLYFLMLLVNVLVAISIGYDLPPNLWRYFFFLQNFATEHIPFFPESWSLSVEEYAYLIAPLCLFLCSKFIVNKERIFIFTAIFLSLVFFVTKVYYQLNFAKEYQTMLLWNSHLKSIVIYRLDAIFYGFIMAYLFCKNFEGIKKMKNVLLLMGITICFAVLIVVPFLGVFIENCSWYWNVLYLPLNSIGIALMLPYLYFLKEPRKSLKYVIEKVSLYSYAMYLLHYTFILYLMQVNFNFETLSFLQRLLFVLVYFGLTYLLSKLVYTCFERPFTNLRDSNVIKHFFIK